MSTAPEEVLSAAKLALTINRLRSEQPASGLLYSEPIAVVGIGCRLPGGVQSPDDYWQLLRAGRNIVSEVPPDRWNSDQYYGHDFQAPGKMNTRWGGFLPGVDQFDPSFFGISPREAAFMDPQQRLLLEVAWEALWDAGIAPDRLAGSSTGVFVGIYGTDYARLLLDNPRAIGSHTCAGAAHSMASGRISFLLDLHGPSVSVDTACSSSLVAVHLACQSLRARSCRVAVAAGVSLKLRPEHYLCLSKLGMISPDGQCRTFDAAGNGFVPGEGCGVVLLKPLADALMEKCRIYAVIRGTAANQDGHTNSLTAPNGLAQQKVVTAAIENARISPAAISYVETHGTGTALGDPIEVDALAEAIGSTALTTLPCALGAVKTNLGHLEAASGITGFIKAVLALHHEEIPPNLHYQECNPHISLDGTRFFVPVNAVPWPRSSQGRFAGVSSFGFSGTNVHIVLEEAPLMPVSRGPQASVSSRSWVVPLSARTPEACDALVRSWHSFLDGRGAQVPLYDLAHSAATRHSHYEERLAITVTSVEDLRARLDDLLSGRSGPAIARGRASHDAAQVVFVFSGQGSQWPGMGRGLAGRFPVFRAALEECDAAVRRSAEWSLIDLLASHDDRLAHTEYAQPAIFAMEVALARLWQSWGITPAAVLGHSIGEVAAAHVAGVLSLESAARLVVLRGRHMESAATRGRMAVLYQPAADVARDIASLAARLSIACVNSPQSTVISGDSAAVEEFVNRQRERGIASRPVRVEYAFHSALMQSSSEIFARELGSLALQSMQVPMISTVTGSHLAAADLDTAYWARNVRQPVLFANAVNTAASLHASAWLEVGPHPVLLDSISECLQARSISGVLVPSLRRGADEPEAMLSAIGRLYTAGSNLAWDKIYSDVVPPVALPAYPWQHQRIWIESPPAGPASDQRPFAMRPVRSPALKQAAFETEFSLETLPWLADHNIAGQILLPMTGFVEIARRALEAHGDSPASLSDFTVLEPLVLPQNGRHTVQILFDADTFRIFSLDGDAWTLHATGRSLAPSADRPITPTPMRGFTQARIDDGAADHYTRMAAAGAVFGPAFQTVAAVSPGKDESWTRVRLAESEQHSSDDYLLHPALLDGCFQSVIPALSPDRRSTLYLPFSIGTLSVFDSLGGELTVHTAIRPESTEESVVADLDLWRGDRLAARVSRLRMNRLPVQRAADRRLFEIRWRRHEAGAPLASGLGHWLILSDDAQTAAELSQSLAQIGCTATIRTAGADLHGLPALRGVIRLCEPELEESPEEAAIQASVAMLALMHRLLAVNPAQPPQFCLVTRGAATLPDSSGSPALAQSALLGIMRTLAMEHPELRCLSCDLDSATPSVQSIAGELAAWDGEREIAWRMGQRWVRRLVPLTPQRWVIGTPGSIENLTTESIPDRAPAPGEVEIEVEASALNFRDVLTVLGMYPGAPPPLGLEFCGRVVRCGAGVTDRHIGDRVAGIAWGSLAANITTPAALTFAVPPQITSAEAATLPNAFLTARYCLLHLAQLRPGQRVLIHAATGGVGLAAVQTARDAGAVIFATAGSEEKRNYLHRLGIEHVFSSRSLDFAHQIAEATAGEGVDVVLNSLAGDFISAGFSVLRPGGCFVEIGKTGIWSDQQARLFRPECRYFVVDLAAVIETHPEEIREHLEQIRSLTESHSIVPLPAHVYEFQNAPQAFRLMSQARHIGKIVLRHPSPLTIRPDRTYLVTGGLGAIGLSAAEWLARSGARYIVLMGRHAPSDYALSVISTLEESGVRVVVRATDVSSRVELAETLDDLRAALPALGGILHAAGVVDDGIIGQQTPERLRRVMLPKIAGAWNLHQLTRNAPLDFFLLFSSLSSVTGSPAQAGYSGANAWMDALAYHRRCSGLPALSVNWGPWSGGGMASAVDAAGRRLSLPGLTALTPEESWECFEEAVARGSCQVVITQADWEKWVPLPPLLSELVRRSPILSTAPSSEPSLNERLAATPQQNRRAVLLEYLRVRTGQILGLPADARLDEREPLIRMGLDSLMAVELRNQLSAALARPLMATLLFDHPTLAALADFLLTSEKPAVAEQDLLLEELQSLSDAEAEELLKQELERP